MCDLDHGIDWIVVFVLLLFAMGFVLLFILYANLHETAALHRLCLEAGNSTIECVAVYGDWN